MVNIADRIIYDVDQIRESVVQEIGLQLIFLGYTMTGTDYNLSMPKLENINSQTDTGKISKIQQIRFGLVISLDGAGKVNASSGKYLIADDFGNFDFWTAGSGDNGHYDFQHAGRYYFYKVA